MARNGAEGRASFEITNRHGEVRGAISGLDISVNHPNRISELLWDVVGLN